MDVTALHSIMMRAVNCTPPAKNGSLFRYIGLRPLSCSLSQGIFAHQNPGMPAQLQTLQHYIQPWWGLWIVNHQLKMDHYLVTSAWDHYFFPSLKESFLINIHGCQHNFHRLCIRHGYSQKYGFYQPETNIFFLPTKYLPPGFILRTSSVFRRIRATSIIWPIRKKAISQLGSFFPTPDHFIQSQVAAQSFSVCGVEEEKKGEWKKNAQLSIHLSSKAVDFRCRLRWSSSFIKDAF